MIFGRGLVSTSEDFGMQGKPPTHPELLDWLARDFVSSGWNLHHLLKKMVLSHTYRQESRISQRAKDIDPENLLLSRSPAYRLPAEMIRDGLLSHSNLLHKKLVVRVPSLTTLRYPLNRSIRMGLQMSIAGVCTPTGKNRPHSCHDGTRCIQARCLHGKKRTN